VILKEQEIGAVRVLRPEGPLKAADVDQFQQRILEMIGASLGRCVLDASAIQYVDSKGLEALVDANDQIAETGQSLKLCGVTDTVRQVLDLTNLAARFEYYADVNAAVRSFL
jgi:anti-sigma B factor antagonist